MANIALNKPSGGQLILSPEDGTSTETVTIPSDGVMKGAVVGDAFYKTGVHFLNGSGSYADTPLTVTINKKYANSYILITASSAIQAYKTTGGGARAGLRIVGTSGFTEDYQAVVRSYDGGDSHVVSANVISQGRDTTTATGNITYTVQIANLLGQDVRMGIDGDGQAYSTIYVYEVKQ